MLATNTANDRALASLGGRNNTLFNLQSLPYQGYTYQIEQYLIVAKAA